MTDGVSQEQFYSALSTLEQRLISKIDQRANQLETKLEEHADDDRRVAERVLVIETQRFDERAAAVRRGTWAGILAAAGVSGVWEFVKHVWK